MWNERFSGTDYLFGTEPADFVKREAATLAPGRTVLSVADGEGRNSVYLAGLGHKVTAMDGSEVGVAKAQRLAAAKGVQVAFNVADIAAWDLQSTQYDVVLRVFLQSATKLAEDKVPRGVRPRLKSLRREVRQSEAVLIVMTRMAAAGGRAGDAWPAKSGRISASRWTSGWRCTPLEIS